MSDPERQPLLGNGGQDETQRTKLNRWLNSAKPLTFLEQTLIALVVFVFCVAAIFAGLFAGQKHINHHSPARPDLPTPAPQDVCLSALCVKQAAHILEGIDDTVDPCDDFYHFANGQWLKLNPVPEGKGRYDSFNSVLDDNKRILNEILAEDIPKDASEADQHNLQHLKNYYQACLNETALDEQGTEPLIKLLQPLLKSWRSNQPNPKSHWLPVILPPVQDLPPPNQRPLPPPHKPRTDPTRVQRLTEALAYLHLRGVSTLWEGGAEGDVKNDPETLELWLAQGDLGLPHPDYYKDEDALTVYRKVAKALLVSVYKELGVPQKTAEKEVPAVADLVVDLESELAKAHWDVVRADDPILTYNPYSVKELANLTDNLVDFNKYLTLLDPKPTFPERVIVAEPSYFANLSSIIGDVPDEVLEAYFIWQISLSYGMLLGPNQPVRQQVNRLRSFLRGIPEDVHEPRQETCLDSVDSNLGFLIGRYFVERAFAGKSKEYAEDIIHSNIAEFKKKLPKLPWLDEETAKRAQIKADSIRVKIGYPTSPNTTDAGSLERYYKLQAPFDSKDHFGNVIRSTEAEVRRGLSKIGAKVDHGEWEMTPSTVNAYYDPSSNEIVFPAGILRGSFFDGERPAYLNYGAFGSVAGHELTHAFDKAGRLYDEHGRLTNWWTNETNARFTEQQQCIIDQYATYYITGADGKEYHINSRYTIGEDAADLGGLGQAFAAWKTQFESDPNSKEHPNFLLPGLNYTREQLFFIAFARGWASSIKPAEAVRLIRTDPHSPARFRVLGPLSNDPDFARAFNCPAGSTYNPKKQCSLW